MIFCQKRYKELNNKNHNHTSKEWFEMVKKNEQYCENWNLFKRFEMYFYKWHRGFNYSDLPSQHPYWKLQVKKDYRLIVKTLQEKYEECKKDNSKIKYMFNRNTSLKDIEDKIERYKLRC